MNVLVTGAAGYIGSHAVARLLRDGHTVVGVDNLFRGHARAVELAAQAAPARHTFVRGDCVDAALLEGLLGAHRVEAVLHFAGRAYPNESLHEPLAYYRDNMQATLAVLEAVARAGTPRLVFSSSCSTYGEIAPEHIPVRETAPKEPVSPYGLTKLLGERMIEDFAESQRRAGRPFAWSALRYFNVAGFDRTGVLGADHRPEIRLIPLVLQAAQGRRESVSIFGTDYPTPDGTCVRDYIHVDDLVDAHVRVLDWLTPAAPDAPPSERPAFNLGIGRGYSVREIIEVARRVTGRPIRVVESPRRAGDPAVVYADCSKVDRLVGWRARITDLGEIVDSAWRWMLAHPRGYAP